MTSISSKVATVGLILAVVSFSEIHGQQQFPFPEGNQSPASSGTNFVRYLINDWTGKIFESDHGVVPFSFSLDSYDGASIRVAFNSTPVTDKDNKYYNPEIFGIMFRGENDRFLEVQVQRSSAFQVSMYDGYDKKLDTSRELHVTYTILPSVNNSWNGTIQIPVEYFPRGTNSLAVYANLTSPGNNLVILTLPISHPDPNVIRDRLPNLYKPIFFESLDFRKYMPLVQFRDWPAIWQDLVHITSGGSFIGNGGNNTTGKHQPDAGGTGSQVHQPLVMYTFVVSFVLAKLL